MNRSWAILLERADNNWSASAPDLPGCVATGRTREATLRNMREAIAMHIRGLQEDGQPVPKAATHAETLRVAA